MKKALAILVILACVVGAASAEITFGAWGRGLFVPVASDGISGTTEGDKVDGAYSTMGVSWGTPNIRIGYKILGNSDNIGFEIDGCSDGGSFGITDQNKIWAKPVKGLTLSMGRVFDDTLRGNACFGTWDWLRSFGSLGVGEDYVFTRMDTLSTGFQAAYTVSGLYVGASFNKVSGELAKHLAQNAMYEAGYTIANIGLIRASWSGTYNDEVASTTTTTKTYSGGAWAIDPLTGLNAYSGVTTTTVTDNKDGIDAYTAGTFNAAFRLTAVKDLTVDLGVFAPTNTGDGKQNKYVSSHNSVDYKMNALALHAVVGVDSYTDEVNLLAKKTTNLTLGAGADYALAGGIGISGEVRYLDKNAAAYATGTNKARTSGFAGVTKGFSNGLVGAGVEIYSQDSKTGYCIPVRFDYSF